MHVGANGLVGCTAFVCPRHVIVSQGGTYSSMVDNAKGILLTIKSETGILSSCDHEENLEHGVINTCSVLHRHVAWSHNEQKRLLGKGGKELMNKLVDLCIVQKMIMLYERD